MKMQPLISFMVATLLGGCSTQPVHIDDESFNFTGSMRSQYANEFRAASLDRTCFLRLGAFEDERVDKQSLGHAGGRPITADDFASVVRNRFQAQLAEANFFRVANNGSDHTETIELSARIIRAYMRSVGTSMSATIAMRVTLEVPEEFGNDVLLRGKGSRINWWGAQEEFEQLLFHAITDAINRLEPQLSDMCRTVNSPTESAAKTDSALSHGAYQLAD